MTAKRPRIADLDSIPWPRWDLTPIANYLDRQLGFGVRRGRSMPLLATRGCPYQSTFCSNPQMWTRRWLARDPHDVVREIEHYVRHYDIQNVDFYDLTAIVKREWLVAFATLLIEKNVKITWQLPSGTALEALDDEVYELAYRSGCRNMTYARERLAENSPASRNASVSTGCSFPCDPPCGTASTPSATWFSASRAKPIATSGRRCGSSSVRPGPASTICRSGSFRRIPARNSSRTSSGKGESSSAALFFRVFPRIPISAPRLPGMKGCRPGR